MIRQVKINDQILGRPAPFVFFSGPCVIEDQQNAYDIAEFLKRLTDRLKIPFIFKASYDKANRTSIDSFRGPGLDGGLEVLSAIRRDLGVSVMSDVHQVSEIAAAAVVLDVIQIPAFLCRQTDLIVAAAKTGKPVNIKKGQFLAPWDMANAVAKARSAGNDRVMLTERGATFGYNNLVTDFRAIPIMQQTGCPVIFDATHSVQLPGGGGGVSSGQREFAPLLAKAAIAVGADGIFMETHPDPDHARSDGPNAVRLDDMENILLQLKNIENALNRD
ncbi:MAG: 3-deoxy-8-phosphooctulonate synthase [Desulfobacteraceae bacterium]|jgi:2-dehydro-3-deoxyphosphooctonate aldolase (KDO 8-P synthase)|nr:MAG: 3-deoxy-8-phosphooctulonate synthase [Desulfobacteraceae bacterium]